MCPISMTYSVIPALRQQPELAEEWEPRFGSLEYDRRLVPAVDKKGALCGMGDDREAGRLRRPGQHDHRAPAERRRPRRRVRADRPQVVLLGADVRRVPRARAGRRRDLLLPDAPLPPRRRAQPHPPPAAEGQARQPLQRLLRGRVRRRVGPPRRRGGRWRADDHRDGQLHPAGLRGRLVGRDAPRHRRRDQPHLPPLGVRKDPDRPAADAERARRSCCGVRGGDDLIAAPRPGLRRVDRGRRAGDRAETDLQRCAQVLDLQARALARIRGARVLRRERLRGRVRDAADVPREPAGIDLGGLGQRAGAGRAARPGA